VAPFGFPVPTRFDKKNPTVVAVAVAATGHRLGDRLALRGREGSAVVEGGGGGRATVSTALGHGGGVYVPVPTPRAHFVERKVTLSLQLHSKNVEVGEFEKYREHFQLRI